LPILFYAMCFITTEDEFTNGRTEPQAEVLVQATDQHPAPVDEASVYDDRVKAVAEAKPLALNWIDNAAQLLGHARQTLDPNAAPDVRGTTGLEAVRRHFHTDRRNGPVTECEAIDLVERNFRSIRQFLATSDAIFDYADDETASENTRGYFGSEFTVAAYVYSLGSISFTSDYTDLGLKCRAAVIIHQLAHFIDPRVRDYGCTGLAYEELDFETALFNIHSYPNFAVNATPPYADARFGMMRPNE
jgi:hypothetical protein